MNEFFVIRPHHFLCIAGHRGAGYTPKHAKVWDKATALMDSMPDIKVKVVEGRDALCFSCPGNKGPAKCKDIIVAELDRRVSELANLKNGEFYRYHDVLAQLRRVLNPSKHEELCGECHWWELCKDTFQKSEI